MNFFNELRKGKVRTVIPLEDNWQARYNSNYQELGFRDRVEKMGEMNEETVEQARECLRQISDMNVTAAPDCSKYFQVYSKEDEELQHQFFRLIDASCVTEIAHMVAQLDGHVKIDGNYPLTRFMEDLENVSKKMTGSEHSIQNKLIQKYKTIIANRKY